MLPPAAPGSSAGTDARAGARALLERRLARPALGRLGARTTLRHFALITYALPKSRLAAHVPEDRFEIQEFAVQGRELALLSVVPFLDTDFHFPRLLPFPRASFGQTNHRVYVTDRRTGEPSVWFLGTTLGSPMVAVPRHAWRLPWHRARYRFLCDHDEARRRYTRYAIEIDSAWGAGSIELEDTGEPADLLEGFTSLDEQTLVLTHPTAGFFRRRDGRPGPLDLAEEMRYDRARPRLFFALHERLALSREMERGALGPRLPASSSTSTCRRAPSTG
jgi:uncharacterized protein YqjF (DUF2071 family)